MRSWLLSIKKYSTNTFRVFRQFDGSGLGEVGAFEKRQLGFCTNVQ
jgi:hypothetical protein